MDRASAFQRKRKKGVLLFLLTLCLPLHCIGLDIGILLSIDFVLCMLFIARYFKYLRILELDRFDTFIVLFIGWMLISQLYNVIFQFNNVYAVNTSLRLSFLRPILQCSRLMLFFFFYKILKNFLWYNDDAAKKVLMYLSMVFLLISLYGVYQIFALRFDWPLANIKMIRSPGVVGLRSIYENFPRMKRIFATFMEPSNYGHFLIMAIFIQLGIAGVLKKKLYIVTTFLLLLNLFFTFARGSLLACALGFLFFGILVENKTFFRNGFLLIVAFIFLFLLVQDVYNFRMHLNEFTSSILKSYTYGYDRASIRILSRTREALALGMKNPLFGMGFGNAVTVLRRQGEIAHIRGLLPSLFADTGLMGVFLFSMFLFRHVHESLKNGKRMLENRNNILVRYCGGALLCSFIQMSFLYKGGIHLTYFWFFLALAAAYNKRTVRDSAAQAPQQ